MEDGNRRSAAAWRARALVEIQNLRAQLTWIVEVSTSGGSNDPVVKALANSVRTQLDQAERVVKSRGPRLSLITGADVQAAREYIDAAETNLLRLSPADHLRSLLPSLLIEARRHLDTNDLRLQALARIQEDATKLTDSQRLFIVAVAEATQMAAHQEQTRVRGFRNVILGVTAVIFSVAALVALLGYINPTAFPLCFLPEQAGQVVVVCPGSQSLPFSIAPLADGASTPLQDMNDAIQKTVGRLDVVLVQFFGVLGATISAASSLRNIRASADPFSLGVALALLKLPTGALTAFLGITFIRSGVVPGLSALDTSAQIVAWSITLGYSQQLFTRFVDQQGQQILQQAEALPTK